MTDITIIEGSGFPMLRLATKAMIEEAEDVGIVGNPEFEAETWLLTAVARGITLALAGPEWAQAALIESGVSPTLVAESVAARRQWIAQHPITLAAPS